MIKNWNNTLDNIMLKAKRSLMITAGAGLCVLISIASSKTYCNIQEAERVNSDFQKTEKFLYLKSGYDAVIHTNPGPNFKQRIAINRLYYEQYHELLNEYKNNLNE